MIREGIYYKQTGNGSYTFYVLNNKIRVGVSSASRSDPDRSITFTGTNVVIRS